MTTLIGLTGGIATGKSTVSGMIAKYGIPIIDADKIAHDCLDKPEVQKQLIKYFGDNILSSKKVNRRMLGKKVFSNHNKLKQLNAIMEPVIRQQIIEKIKLQRDQKVVVLDAPLLFEQHYDKMMDFIIVVYTDYHTQIKRLMKRDGISIGDAEKRVRVQMPIKEKIKYADLAVNNNMSIEYTKSQVIKWLLCKKIVLN